MANALTTIGLLAEVFTIIGLALGALCFVILFAVRVSRGPWEVAPAAISDGRLNWLTPDGHVRSRDATDDEIALARDDDELEVFHRRRASGCHFTRSAPDESALLLLGIIMAGIGVLAVVASFALLFLE